MVTKKQKKKSDRAIVNRRASFDYTLGDEIIVGMMLSGPETRAARDGHVQLKGAYITVRNHELWLNNSSFSLLNQQNTNDRVISLEPRKLLASKKQIAALENNKKSGFSIIPIKILNNKRYIKLVIALGKGKKRYDKRETLKRRDQERESNKLIRGKL